MFPEACHRLLPKVVMMLWRMMPAAAYGLKGTIVYEDSA
jgi:hypothetical protein